MRHVHRIGGLLMILTAGCAVISADIRQAALPPMPFSELIAQADSYKGRTVILGGYVVSVENHKGAARIIAVQAPLGTSQAPGSKDLSEGRLIIVHDGFVDPEVYTKNRRITVGGDILSGAAGDPVVGFPHIEIRAKELYLWGESPPLPPPPFWLDEWYMPYPGWYGPHGRFVHRP